MGHSRQPLAFVTRGSVRRVTARAGLPPALLEGTSLELRLLTGLHCRGGREWRRERPQGQRHAERASPGLDPGEGLKNARLAVTF